jgi:hypothetical protein
VAYVTALVIGKKSTPKRWYHQCSINDATKTNVSSFIPRDSFLLALAGAFIGVLIGWNNGDEMGRALLRAAVLFLAFGSIAHWWLGSMAKAWLEGRVESITAKTKAVETHPTART